MGNVRISLLSTRPSLGLRTNTLPFSRLLTLCDILLEYDRLWESIEENEGLNSLPNSGRLL